MGLEQQLAAFKAEFARTAPAGRPALYEAKIEELRASFALEAALGTGDDPQRGIAVATVLAIPRPLNTQRSLPS